MKAMKTMKAMTDKAGDAEAVDPSLEACLQLAPHRAKNKIDFFDAGNAQQDDTPVRAPPPALIDLRVKGTWGNHQMQAVTDYSPTTE